MAKIAFVFAGQGAQYTGMGQDLYKTNSAAKDVFQMADGVRPGTSDLCFSADKAELSQTVNTQPALFAVDLACAAALAQNGVEATAVAGFSLGEWPAIAFSGMLSYEDAFALTCKRAEFMHECAEKKSGAMVAVMRLENSKVEELCADFTQVYPVNYNCPGQLVVAGVAEQIDDFVLKVKEAGGRAIKLAVSGAFHSPLMSEAADKLAMELDKVNFKMPEITVYSNVTALPYENGSDLLTRQVKSSVKWQMTIENMIADGYDIFIEVGAGKTLSGLIKKISKDVKVFNVGNAESLQTTVEAVKGV